MKYFFLIFIFLCSFSSAFSQETPSNISSDKKDEASSFIQLKNHFNQKVQEAKSLNPDDISFFEKPENINIFTLFYLNQKDAGLFTGSNGLGQWKTLPFGRARLVSCTGAIPENKNVFAALEVEPDNGWILKKPSLPISIEPTIQNEQILYPIQNVFQNRTDSYDSAVFFPLLYQLKTNQIDFTLTKNISLTGCRENECQTVPFALSLTLPVGKAYQTDICAAMMNELQITPLPAQQQVRATALTQGDNLIQLVLKFQENIDYINLQIDNPFDWTLEKKYINGKTVHLLISTSYPIPQKTVLNLKILSSAAWYDAPVQIQQGAFIQEKPVFSWGTAFKAGCLLFFFSPLFILFWSLRPQNQKNLSQIIRFVGVTITFVALLYSSALYGKVLSVSVFETNTLTAFLGLLALFYLLIRPQVNLLYALILFFLLPKPYLTETMETLNTNSLQPFQLFALWGFLCFIPFFLFRQQAAFFSQLPQAEHQLRFLKRLPVALLCLWTLSILILPFFIKTPTDFSASKLEKSLQDDKIVFVSVENGACLSCLLNQIGLKYFYPGQTLYKQQKLELFSVKTNTPNGKSLLKRLMLPPFSFGLLYGQKKPYGVLVKSYISPEKWGDKLWSVSTLPNPAQFYMLGEDETPLTDDTSDGLQMCLDPRFY